MQIQLLSLIFEILKNDKKCAKKFRMINQQTKNMLTLDSHFTNHLELQSNIYDCSSFFTRWFSAQKNDFEIVGSTLTISPFDPSVVDLKIGGVLLDKLALERRSGPINFLIESIKIVYTSDEWKTVQTIEVKMKRLKHDCLFVYCWLKNIKLSDQSRRILYMMSLTRKGLGLKSTIDDNNQTWNYQMVLDWKKLCSFCQKSVNSWFRQYHKMCFDCYMTNQKFINFNRLKKVQVCQKIVNQ